MYQVGHDAILGEQASNVSMTSHADQKLPVGIIQGRQAAHRELLYSLAAVLFEPRLPHTGFRSMPVI